MNGKQQAGFSFIELILVMAVLTLLIALVTPDYFRHLKQAEETALKNNLAVMRRAVEDYYADRGQYPPSLKTLVDFRYLKKIPADPVTQSDGTWIVLPPPGEGDGVYDVRSGAGGEDNNGTPYQAL